MSVATGLHRRFEATPFLLPFSSCGRVVRRKTSIRSTHQCGGVQPVSRARYHQRRDDGEESQRFDVGHQPHGKRQPRDFNVLHFFADRTATASRSQCLAHFGRHDGHRRAISVSCGFTASGRGERCALTSSAPLAADVIPPARRVEVLALQLGGDAADDAGTKLGISLQHDGRAFSKLPNFWQSARRNCEGKLKRGGDADLPLAGQIEGRVASSTNGVRKMKKLLVAAGLALAFTVPASANEKDKAVARAVVFMMFCDDLPEELRRQTSLYVVDHQQQIASESKAILDEKAKGMDQKTWCRQLRSKVIGPR
jgi:hypothetical protein